MIPCQHLVRQGRQHPDVDSRNYTPSSIPMSYSRMHCTFPETSYPEAYMSSGSSLARSLGSKLLTRILASSGLAGSLFSASHDDISRMSQIRSEIDIPKTSPMNNRFSTFYWVILNLS